MCGGERQGRKEGRREGEKIQRSEERQYMYMYKGRKMDKMSRHTVYKKSDVFMHIQYVHVSSYNNQKGVIDHAECNVNLGGRSPQWERDSCDDGGRTLRGAVLTGVADSTGLRIQPRHGNHKHHVTRNTRSFVIRFMYTDMYMYMYMYMYIVYQSQ